MVMAEQNQNSTPLTDKNEEETKAESETKSKEEEYEILILPENSIHSPGLHMVSDLSDFSFSQTLTMTPSMENDHVDSDCHSFSELLAGAMASPTKLSPSVKPEQVSMDVSPVGGVIDIAGLKVGQFGMSHQEALASVTAQAQAQMQLQAACPSLSSEILPIYQAHSISSEMSLIPFKQELAIVSQEPKNDQPNSSEPKLNPANLVLETPASDGYSWRKYGQKRVKSRESSRSYYKCTYSTCHAKKKIENCDHSGRLIQIIYNDQHNHDPPQKIRCSKVSVHVSSVGPVACTGSDGGSGIVERSAPSVSEGVSRYATAEQKLLTSSECARDADALPEQKLLTSSECARDADAMAGEGQDGEPQPKRRMKYKNVACSAPRPKLHKEPKVVVQTAVDAGTQGDGYRWCKYGQKMVKGNPHPRSYYRCTSAGCHVRKHVERATDESTGIIITYEGKHDHDTPVPKKRNGHPILIAAAPALGSSQVQTSGPLPSTQLSTELIADKALDPGGGEKVLESARALLSIGIELKPC